MSFIFYLHKFSFSSNVQVCYRKQFYFTMYVILFFLLHDVSCKNTGATARTTGRSLQTNVKTLSIFVPIFRRILKALRVEWHNSPPCFGLDSRATIKKKYFIYSSGRNRTYNTTVTCCDCSVVHCFVDCVFTVT